jgi:hypothetical protein
MSSIPNSAMPHAFDKAAEAAPRERSRTSQLLHLAAVPPFVALGIGAIAYSALRSLASDMARKIKTSGGSSDAVPFQRSQSAAALSGGEKLAALPNEATVESVNKSAEQAS